MRGGFGPLSFYPSFSIFVLSFLNPGQLLTGLTKAWLGNFGEIGHPSEGASIPSGIITMWSGLSTAIPTGWVLCDGNNGTPDLRNRFIVGAGSEYVVGSVGGEATHILTTDQLPSHSHGINLSGLEASSAGAHEHNLIHSVYNEDRERYYYYYPYHYSAAANGSGFNTIQYNTSQHPRERTYAESAGSHTHTITGSASITETGSGVAHENRPPYYALCFIMKQ